MIMIERHYLEWDSLDFGVYVIDSFNLFTDFETEKDKLIEKSVTS